MVTAVSILCPRRPNAVNVALLGKYSKTLSQTKSQKCRFRKTHDRAVHFRHFIASIGEVSPFVGCESFARVLQTFREAKGKLAEVLSAYEFFDSGSMQVVQSNLKLDNPIGDYPFYVLLETSGSNGSHDEEKLTVFLEDVMSSGTVLDGTMATESSKIKVKPVYYSNTPSYFKNPNICVRRLTGIHFAFRFSCHYFIFLLLPNDPVYFPGRTL